MFPIHLPSLSTQKNTQHPNSFPMYPNSPNYTNQIQAWVQMNISKLFTKNSKVHDNETRYIDSKQIRDSR